MKPLLMAAALLIGLVAVTVASAASPVVHYQGRLMHEDGTSFSGTTDIRFSIFRNLEAEEPIWSETHENVPVTDGSYRVLLGSHTPLNLSFYEYYLDVEPAALDVDLPRRAIAGFGYNYRLSFLFAAYTIVWLALFAYVLSVSRRQKRIINELERLSAQPSESSVSRL